MKFNPDCVRDILLTAEEIITDKTGMEYESENQYERLKKYSFSAVAYHIQQCQEYELLKYKENILGGYEITKILPAGNEICLKSREESVWKDAIKKGISSIPAMISFVNEAFTLWQNLKQ